MQRAQLHKRESWQSQHTPLPHVLGGTDEEGHASSCTFLGRRVAQKGVWARSFADELLASVCAAGA